MTSRSFRQLSTWTQIREDFPVLKQKIHGKPLVYLDNAATAQKPQAVIDAITRFYSRSRLRQHPSRRARASASAPPTAYEETRVKVQRFLNARSKRTRSSSSAAPPKASTWWRRPAAASNVSAGDEIIISGLEHHSNIVPWQMLCEEKGAKLRVIPINDAAS